MRNEPVDEAALDAVKDRVAKLLEPLDSLERKIAYFALNRSGERMDAIEYEIRQLAPRKTAKA